MSNTPAFTTQVKTFEADPATDRPAFTSTTLDCTTVSVSGFEHDDENRSHVTGYVHAATSIRVERGLDFDGAPSLRLTVTGDVNTYLTVFGVSLDDLAAAIEAARSAS